VINKIRNAFRFDVVCLSQDWHPESHVSFLSHHLETQSVLPFTTVRVPSKTDPTKHLEQTVWPDHCVQGSRGADFAPALQRFAGDTVIQKGTSALEDSPDLFNDDLSLRQTQLAHVLANNNISDVYVVGIGFEGFLTRTALACAQQGYATHVIIDAVCALHLLPGTAAASDGTSVTAALSSTSAAAAAAGRSSDLLPASASAERTKVLLEQGGVALTRFAVMQEERDDKGKDAARYLERHGVLTIFERVCAALVFHRPSDPKEYVIKELQKLQESNGALNTLSLFTDDDIEAYFNMVDAARKGVLSQDQAKAALEGLGYAMDSFQSLTPDSYTKSEFKILVQRAMEQPSRR
jgi:nicotinamidase-related amidase